MMMKYEDKVAMLHSQRKTRIAFRVFIVDYGPKENRYKKVESKIVFGH